MGATAGSTAVANGSHSVAQPQDWLPREFFRFYTSPAFPHILAFVSVVLHAPGKGYRLEQAIVVAGWIDYGVGSSVGHWEYWFARWHFWMGDREDDGKLCTQDPQIWTKSKPPVGVKQASTFALPLEEVTSGQVLRERIVDRLLLEISRRAASSEAIGNVESIADESPDSAGATDQTDPEDAGEASHGG